MSQLVARYDIWNWPETFIVKMIQLLTKQLWLCISVKERMRQVSDCMYIPIYAEKGFLHVFYVVDVQIHFNLHQVNIVHHAL